MVHRAQQKTKQAFLGTLTIIISLPLLFLFSFQLSESILSFFFFFLLLPLQLHSCFPPISPFPTSSLRERFPFCQNLGASCACEKERKSRLCLRRRFRLVKDRTGSIHEPSSKAQALSPSLFGHSSLQAQLSTRLRRNHIYRSIDSGYNLLLIDSLPGPSSGRQSLPCAIAESGGMGVGERKRSPLTQIPHLIRGFRSVQSAFTAHGHIVSDALAFSTLVHGKTE
jgi:hypothetical protein